MSHTMKHLPACADIPDNVMCPCQEAELDKAKASEADPHPEPGGHHNYIQGRCECGATHPRDDDDIVLWMWGHPIRKIKRYLGDTVTYT